MQLKPPARLNVHVTIILVNIKIITEGSASLSQKNTRRIMANKATVSHLFHELKNTLIFRRHYDIVLALQKCK
jgi:hypothetical protein